ncbi:MAG TPA: preprotein translocase subunit SecE [Acidocella sp.]|jgi:preprotein translocase subunit SecE|uniref:preprotein translocase subunit SecE n=1 Tax=Acidocella sp. TaxID=50710 RepID=UPI002C17958E|nr:preprotein translocase subunit SecE [Acidocella sp.]HVE20495.1 preprotein translocase subunit SecE [Acidocella sp.]
MAVLESALAFNLVKFMREVRAEAAKTTWPSRKETVQTTGLVLAMVIVTAVFFLTVDQLIGAGIRALFGGGS